MFVFGSVSRDAAGSRVQNLDRVLGAAPAASPLTAVQALAAAAAAAVVFDDVGLMTSHKGLSVGGVSAVLALT